jgi:hypothetical protein
VAIADSSRLVTGATAHLSMAPTGDANAALKVIARPAAVDPGTSTLPVRLAFTRAAKVPAGTFVQVDIDAEQHTNVVLVPVAAIVREGEETAVFVTDGKTAHRRAIKTGLSDGEQTEIPVRRQRRRHGDRRRPGGTPGRSDGHGREEVHSRIRTVTFSATAFRQSRAITLVLLALVAGGAFAMRALPSSIYPPLQFPRIVIVAHAGTLPPQSMSLIVTRPSSRRSWPSPGSIASARAAFAAPRRSRRSSIRRPT